MMQFMIGCLIGSCAGILMMCLIYVNRDNWKE
jgi:uncharacterized membrane protein YccC